MSNALTHNIVFLILTCPLHFLSLENRGVQIGPEYLSSLPLDLQHFVEEDNATFLVEMEQWDFEQSRKKDSSTMTMADTECTIIGERKKGKLSIEISSEHLGISCFLIL